MLLYSEKIYSRWNIGLFSIVVIFLGTMLTWQIITGPVGTNPSPDWFYVLMLAIFLSIGINFAVLKIKITSERITVAYGLIRYDIPWLEVSGCRLDGSRALNYGGWGIRMGIVNGKRRLIYSVIGGPRVVIEKREGVYPEFVFSTRHPQDVIKVINQRIGR